MPTPEQGRHGRPDDLRRRGVGFTSLHENIDTTTPGGRLVFHVFAALAEFIRELIVAGTREGLVAARASGRIGGRPTVVTPELLRAARDMLPNPDNSITSIAERLGVSPGTLYNHIPDLQETACEPYPARRRRGLDMTRAPSGQHLEGALPVGFLDHLHGDPQHARAAAAQPGKD